MPEFSSHPAFDIARRLELRGEQAYTWLAVLHGGQKEELAIGEFVRELRLLLDRPPRIVDVTGLDLTTIRNRLQQPSDDTVILCGLEHAAEPNWRSFDVNRSALERTGATILWLSPESVVKMNTLAPNLRSFIGGSIFVLSEEGGIMTAEERERRLSELRTAYELSDEAVIQQANRGTLPAEPEYAEWLVLLGRGDLLWH